MYAILLLTGGSGWSIIFPIILIFMYLAICFFVAGYGSRGGYNIWLVLTASVVLSPVTVLIVLAFIGPKAAEKSH